MTVSNHPQHLQRISIEVTRVVSTQCFPALVDQTQRNAISDPGIILKDQDRGPPKRNQPLLVGIDGIRNY